MIKWSNLLWRAAKACIADNAFKHSAAVSFYTLFSLAPITIIAIKIMGIFLGDEIAARQFSAQVTGLVGQGSAEMIRAAAKASQAASTSGFSAAVGIALLAVGATTVFGQLQDSLNSIWKVKPKPRANGIIILLVRRVISFAMVLTIGFLLLVSLVLTTAIAAGLGMIHGHLGTNPILLKSVDFVASLVVITFLFALIFKVLPDVKLAWRDVWVGAFVTSILFGLGRYLIALYLDHSTVASIYGTAGSLVALLIWIYYSCAIFFFGAEFTRVHHLALHGGSVRPKRSAVRVHA
ncbi:MAG: YihY/virulence factor BrkB family protein [Opitutaceae bacterium]